MQLATDVRVGNYRIERELAATKGGVLFQATHVVLPRRAILKVTLAGTADRQLAALQLLREACILDALHHPAVPTIYESGVLDDRRPWYAHEPIEGCTLAELIVRGPIEPLEVAALVRDAGDVLAHAHRRGVIHRGLRPDRILMTPDRRFPISIVDWSDARAHDAAPALPMLPAPGTGHYLAPEMLRGDAIDDRADVFALGALAYLAVTGERPFHRDPTVPHVPTRARRGSVPLPLARLIDQMLAPDRFDRPSAAEVHAELAQLVIDEPEVIDLAATSLRIRRPRWTPAIPLRAQEDVDAIETLDDELS